MTLPLQIRFALLLVMIIVTMFTSSCDKPEDITYICKDSLGCVDIGPDEPLQIGVLQALTGAVGPLGQAQIRGLELAMESRDNILFDHPISLQIEDTGCSPEGGANAALKVIADPQMIAIFGTTCSGAAATASKAMSSAGMVMISGNNSAPFLTSIAGENAPDWQDGYFRTASNEENAGQVAAEYASVKLGFSKAAVMHDNDIYTRGLVDSFSKGFKELGGAIVLSTAVNKGDTEMQPVLEAVANSGAELLFFPLFQPEGNRILTQARKMELMEGIILMSDGALIQESFLADVGELAIGMYFVGPSKPEGPDVEKMSARYVKKYKEDPVVSYYLSGHDAAVLLFYAIEKTAVHSEDGSLHIPRQALRDTLYSITALDGVTGTLSCNAFGDCALPAFNVLRLDNPDQGLNGLEQNVVYTNKKIHSPRTTKATSQ
jgi:branched-chain amino acid transport system substrate-binding protein